MSGKKIVIQHSKTSVNFTEVFASNSTLINRLKVDDFQLNRDDLKVEIKNYIHRLISKENYDQATLFFSDERHFLCPNRVVEESEEHLLYQLTIADEGSKADVSADDITALRVKNVYSLPKEWKDFYEKQFPNIEILHTASYWLKNLPIKQHIGFRVVVLIEPDYVAITLLDGEKMTFYNSFYYQSINDIIYYFLFVLQQKKKMDQSGSLILVSCDEQNDETIQYFKEIIKNQQLIPEISIENTQYLIKNYIDENS